MTEQSIDVVLTVNGVPRAASVPSRRLLSDCLRHDLRLTGTHVGCEHGVCGACTVLLDGEPVRSCLVLAASVDATTGDGQRPRASSGRRSCDCRADALGAATDQDVLPVQPLLGAHRRSLPAVGAAGVRSAFVVADRAHELSRSRSPAPR